MTEDRVEPQWWRDEEAFEKEKARQAKDDDLDAKQDRVIIFQPFDFAVWRAGPDATLADVRVYMNGPMAAFEEVVAYISQKYPRLSEEAATEAARDHYTLMNPHPLYQRAEALLPPPPPPGSEFEAAWKGLSHEILRGEWKKSKDLAAIAEAKTPPFITLKGTLDIDTTDEDFVVGDGILTRGGKLMVYAYAGAGKTTFIDWFAASLGSGLPFLGTHAIDKPHKVLFVQAEMTTSEIASHGQDLLTVFKGTAAEDNVVFWRNTQLPLPSAEQALRDALGETGSDILVLDPFNRFFRGDNSMTQEQVGEVFRMVDRLLEDKDLNLDGAALTHHANVSRLRMAGTYDFEAWPSTILKLEVISPQATTRKLTFEKIRAPRSTLLGTTRVIDLTDEGYVYSGGSAPTIPFAGPYLAAKALGDLGGQAYRQELIDRTMALANVRDRAAKGHIAEAVTQGLILKMPDRGPNNQVVFKLPDQPVAKVEAED